MAGEFQSEHSKIKTMKLTERQNHLLEFVKTQHGEQKRKYTGLPYWTHLLSVAEIVSEYKSVLGVEIALCHDLFEDTECYSEQLNAQLKQFGYDYHERIVIVNDVMHLTDQYTSEQYPDLNRAARKAKEAERLVGISANAQTVKYADIIDNTSSIVEFDPGFARVYIKEIAAKIYKMDKGDTDLHKRCLDTVRRVAFQLDI